MPILEDAYPTSTLELPVSKGTVQVKETYSVDEDTRLGNMDDARERSIYMVLFALVEWDLTNRDGTLLPITFDTVKRLPNTDGQAVMNWIVEQVQKRNKPKEVVEALVPDKE